MSNNDYAYYLINGKTYKRSTVDPVTIPELNSGDMKYLPSTGCALVVREIFRKDTNTSYLGYFSATPEETTYMKTMVLLHG